MGEATNAVVAYLAAVSRKSDRPLAVIQASAPLRPNLPTYMQAAQDFLAALGL